jgi:hypothetical protein
VPCCSAVFLPVELCRKGEEHSLPATSSPGRA